MAQSDALYMDLSGYENLKFFSQLFKMKKGSAENRINDVAALVNLTADLKKKVKTIPVA